MNEKTPDQNPVTMRGRGRPRKDPEMVSTSDPIKVAKKSADLKPIWSRRMAALKREGATPSQMSGDITGIIYPKGAKGKAIEDNCHFLWISHIFEQKRPNLTGWNQDLYEPVTESVMKEMGIDTVAKARTKEGVPRAGQDAVLYWIPTAVKKQQDKILLAGANPSVKLQAMQNEVEGRFANKDADSKALGGFTMTKDEGELEEALEEQRENMGSFGHGPSPIPQFQDDKES